MKRSQPTLANTLIILGFIMLMLLLVFMMLPGSEPVRLRTAEEATAVGMNVDELRYDEVGTISTSQNGSFVFNPIGRSDVDIVDLAFLPGMDLSIVHEHEGETFRIAGYYMDAGQTRVVPCLAEWLDMVNNRPIRHKYVYLDRQNCKLTDQPWQDWAGEWQPLSP